MVCFQTKNPNLGKFWRALNWKMLIYFVGISKFYGHFGCFMTIWYNLCSFGTFFPVLVSCTKKNSGNPGAAYNIQRNARIAAFVLQPLIFLSLMRKFQSRTN
jgi:hypothetical protein